MSRRRAVSRSPTSPDGSTASAIAYSPASGKTVVVVTHVTPIKLLVRQALEAPLRAIYRMELRPASASKILFYPDGTPVPAALRILHPLRSRSTAEPPAPPDVERTHPWPDVPCGSSVPDASDLRSRLAALEDELEATGRFPA